MARFGPVTWWPPKDMSTLYLREWSSAVGRLNCSTPDLFTENRFKVFGIRRVLTKLSASPLADLETLNSRELERLRVDLVAQLSSRIRGTPSENKADPKTTESN